MVEEGKSREAEEARRAAVVVAKAAGWQCKGKWLSLY